MLFTVYLLVLLYAYSVYYTEYGVIGGFYVVYTCKKGVFFRVEGPPYGVSNLH